MADIAETLAAINDPPEPFKKPVKTRRKYKRRAPRAPKAEPRERPPEEFLGLTAKQCPSDCHDGRCIILGAALPQHCAHPFKGGLQSSDMLDHKTVERYGRARKMLAHKDVEKR